MSKVTTKGENPYRVEIHDVFVKNITELMPCHPNWSEKSRCASSITEGFTSISVTPSEKPSRNMKASLLNLPYLVNHWVNSHWVNSCFISWSCNFLHLHLLHVRVQQLIYLWLTQTNQWQWAYTHDLENKNWKRTEETKLFSLQSRIERREWCFARKNADCDAWLLYWCIYDII